MLTAVLPKTPERLADRFEQTAVMALYVWLMMRLWPDTWTAADWYPLLILFSEGLVVIFLLIRRPTDQISMRWRDWALATAGTFTAMLINPGGDPILLEVGGLIMLVGFAIHLGAKLSLFRSFGLVAANRGVKSNGLYAYVRHPMYAGYMVSHIGFLLVAPSWWNLGVYVLVWTLLVARLYAEENVLRQDPEYQAFMERVRYRIVPGVF